MLQRTSIFKNTTKTNRKSITGNHVSKWKMLYCTTDNEMRILNVKTPIHSAMTKGCWLGIRITIHTLRVSLQCRPIYFQVICAPDELKSIGWK